jgi:L-ascorbate metabolism protein UlaG (beta-lactamase superfamily)
MSLKRNKLRRMIILGSLVLLLLSQTKAKGEEQMEEVTLQWFGHAYFLISDKIKIAIDPFQDLEGYPNPQVSADVVLVTHEHFDHNKTEAVSGHPQIVRGFGQKSVKGIEFTGAKTYHDESKGSQRGENTVFVFELDGIRFAHGGDLGHLLSDQQVKEIGRVDVLMIPVGGYYTIDAQRAWTNVEKIKPKIVIPMHYKQPFMGKNFPIEKVDVFLAGKKNVNRLDKNVLVLEKDKLPLETTIYVLNYK